jgi:hypothetical protein
MTDNTNMFKGFLVTAPNAVDFLQQLDPDRLLTDAAMYVSASRELFAHEYFNSQKKKSSFRGTSTGSTLVEPKFPIYAPQLRNSTVLSRWSQSCCKDDNNEMKISADSTAV